jgi:hypothetical protein
MQCTARWIFAAVIVFLPATARSGDKQPIKLLTSQDQTTGVVAGWRAFSEDPKTKPCEVWKLDDEGVLVCRGKPLGYLATDKEYADFTLRLQWRWPKGKPGKGGVLIRTTGPDKIWPKSLEAQINAPDAGDFWGLDGFPLSGPADRMKKLSNPQFGQLTNLKKTANLEKPAGEWNQYEIVAQGGAVTLSINGQVVNRATDCAATPGRICLTSEGDEIHLRNIELVPGK